jgi:hypothetical protein
VSATVDYIRSAVIPAALKFLPPRLDSFEARAMLVAIGLQESRFEHRRQIQGPARGFWQFESAGGVYGVLTHPATKPLITPVLHALRYSPNECYYAIEHNDTLAAVFARLLLFSHPKALPDNASDAWRYYLDTWRPGRPHPETWPPFFAEAWALEAA